MKIKSCLCIISIFFVSLYSYAQTNIQMTKENGIFMVPGIVNGIEMKFIFDTGASIVTISQEKADLLKNRNKLSERDVLGVGQFQTANGDVVIGKLINLKSIKIGDLTLENIKASVIDSPNAPLLLGQNVISKLGGISINGNHLTINYKKHEVNFNDFVEPKQYLETKFNEFFGIDVTKTPVDFNYRLEKPFYNYDFKKEDFMPIGFDELNIRSFKLKPYNFTKEMALFRPDGQMATLILFKESTNHTEANKTFNNLKSLFIEKYSEPDEIKDENSNHFIKWDFMLYQVGILLNNKNEIQVFMIRSADRIKEVYRGIYEKGINDIIYRPDSSEPVFIRFEDNNLIFYQKINGDAVDANIIGKEFANKFLNQSAFILNKGFIQGMKEGNKPYNEMLVRKLYIKDIIFKTDFSSNKIIKQVISWPDFKNLPYPFTDNELKSVLKFNQ